MWCARLVNAAKDREEGTLGVPWYPLIKHVRVQTSDKFGTVNDGLLRQTVQQMYLSPRNVEWLVWYSIRDKLGQPKSSLMLTASG